MSSPLSPYAEGVLPAGHQVEIIKIRTILKSWLSANKDARKNTPGTKEKLDSATKELVGWLPPSLFLKVAWIDD
jgi:hypothetical protein